MCVVIVAAAIVAAVISAATAQQDDDQNDPQAAAVVTIVPHKLFTSLIRLSYLMREMTEMQLDQEKFCTDQKGEDPSHES